MFAGIGKCTRIGSHVTGDHTSRCAVKSYLYMVIANHDESRHLTMVVMMLNVCGDRKVYQDRQSRDRRPYQQVRREKLPIHGNSEPW